MFAAVQWSIPIGKKMSSALEGLRKNSFLKTQSKLSGAEKDKCHFLIIEVLSHPLK